MTRALMVLALCAVGIPAHAQEFSSWSSAVNLGAIVNTNAVEGCPFIAKNELTLFVVSTRAGGYGGQDIYVSQRDSTYDAWGPLENLGPAINSTGNDLCPTLSIDGHRLFFVSDRPGGCGKQDLYVARRRNKRDDFGWEVSDNLGCTVNGADNDFTPSLYENDTTGELVMYFGSDRPGGLGSVDIYSSTRDADGLFAPAVLVAELSTPSIDERPNVRKDGLEIVFDSDRPGTLGGTDLWVATRESVDMPWSTAENLGPSVNSSATELRPSLSFDGRTLYFSSNRSGGSGSQDIYVTTRSRVPGPEQ